MQLKFSIGEKVRVKSTGNIVEVKSFRIDGYKTKGNETIVIQYQVQSPVNLYNTNWYKEDLLESTFEFTNHFEKALADLMIDINLAHQNFHMARNFHTIKQSYSN